MGGVHPSPSLPLAMPLPFKDIYTGTLFCTECREYTNYTGQQQDASFAPMLQIDLFMQFCYAKFKNRLRFPLSYLAAKKYGKNISLRNVIFGKYQNMVKQPRDFYNSNEIVLCQECVLQ